MVDYLDLTLSSDEEEIIEPKSKKLMRQSPSADEQFKLDLAKALADSAEIPPPKKSNSNMPSRLELETERLERNKKRERDGTAVKSNIIRSWKPPNASTLGDIRADPALVRPASENLPSDRFFKGAIRTVYNRFHPNSKTAMSFSDLTGPKEQMTMAFVSAFQMDDPWVASQFDGSPAELYLCRPAREGESAGIHSTLGPGRKIFAIFPNIPGRGIMHVKLNIFVFPTFMRIAITSANAVDFDWDQLENTIYVHDFPILATPTTSLPSKNEFVTPIVKTMVKLGVPPRVMNAFKLYDYSSSIDSVKTVFTFQGIYSGWDKIEESGGIGSLARAVAALGLEGKTGWEIEAAGSSLGSYADLWLVQFYAACSAIHPRSYFGPPGGLRPLDSPTMNLNTISTKFKIVFHTKEEVVNSFAGEGGGGTIFCQMKNWKSNYSNLRFYKNVNKRERVLSHSKTIIASNSSKKNGWVYIGSHNFTAAAWGRLTFSSGVAKASNNNYELGVILPIRASTAESFESIVSNYVSYKRPLERYGAGDVPWCQPSPWG